MLRHIISISNLSKEDLLLVLDRAAEMEKTDPREKAEILKGKRVALLFFEPSTRTRLSFETAAQNLGAHVISMIDAGTSSEAKGESLMDTVRVVEKFADIIVMRHPLMGSTRLAAEVSARPVINAGDGANQHPTQTLLDLYTMRKTFGRIKGLKVGFAGDLKYGRTVHSLALALVHFNVEQVFISPPQLRLPRHILREVRRRGNACEDELVSPWLNKLSLLYATRIQKERFADPMEYEKVRDAYRIDAAQLEGVKPDFKIMHPLPRVGEIDHDVDRTPHAIYFEQLANGVPVREAALSILAEAIE